MYNKFGKTLKILIIILRKLVFNTEDSILCSLNEWAQKTSDFIEQNINENKPIYVHCAQGISRSTACILHYLMTKKGMTLKESFNIVKSKRIVASPTVGFFKDLIDLDIKLFGNSSMSLEDYSLMMLYENFPSLDKNDIDKTYYKYHDLYKNGEKKDKYAKEMNENRYEPIGYHTIDELINGIGKEKFIKRINDKNYDCYSVFYPVGNGRFNIGKSIEDINYIIDNINDKIVV